MMNENGFTPRKQMAMGDKDMDSGNFGVKPLDHSKGPCMTPISEGMKGHVGDNVKRGAAPPMGGGSGKYPKHAQPDHGPHGKR